MAETDKNLKAIKLNDIRNKYILQKIFDFIDKTNSLNIIRYNKAIQNKLDINIDTYKEYSQIIFDIKLFNQEGKLMLKKREGAKVRKKDEYNILDREIYYSNDFDSDNENENNYDFYYDFEESDFAIEISRSRYHEVNSKEEKLNFIKTENKLEPYFHFYFDNDASEKKVNYVTSENNV